MNKPTYCTFCGLHGTIKDGLFYCSFDSKTTIGNPCGYVYEIKVVEQI